MQRHELLLHLFIRLLEAENANPDKKLSEFHITEHRVNVLEGSGIITVRDLKNFVINNYPSGSISVLILQYRHSQTLGEVMNIGLIAYFPSHRQLAFLYPDNLNRLRAAYSSIPEKTIQGYFNIFSERVEEFNANPRLFPENNIGGAFQEFVENEFLPADSSALQFGLYGTSVLYTDDIEHIKSQLYNQYLSVFQH